MVLAEELDAAVAQDLRDRVGDPWDGAQVTLRSGSPLRVEHLQRVDYRNAASVVVPADELHGGSAEVADTEVVKTLLSLNATDESGSGAEMPFAVAELFDLRKLQAARRAYRGPLEVLASDSTVSRLLAQNVRHPGLSLVYDEILSLGEGSEFYVRDAGSFAGSSFGTLPPRFPDAVLAGVLRPEEPTFGSILCPADDFRIEADARTMLGLLLLQDLLPEAAGERVAFRELEARARRERELALGVLAAPSPGREEIDLAPPPRPGVRHEPGPEHRHPAQVLRYWPAAARGGATGEDLCLLAGAALSSARAAGSGGWPARRAAGGAGRPPGRSRRSGSRRARRSGRWSGIRSGSGRRPRRRT